MKLTTKDNTVPLVPYLIIFIPHPSMQLTLKVSQMSVDEFSKGCPTPFYIILHI